MSRRNHAEIAEIAETGVELVSEGGDSQALRCPLCKLFNLHHVRVDVFERHEDGHNGIHVAVNSANTLPRYDDEDNPLPYDRDDAKTSVMIDNDLTGNPSARRHGLSIRFQCEHCNIEPILTIAQHKGTTYVEWTNLPS